MAPSAITTSESFNASFLRRALLIVYMYIVSLAVLTNYSEGVFVEEQRIGGCVYPSYPDKEALNEGREKLGSLLGKRFRSLVETQSESYEFTIGICVSVADTDPKAAALEQPVEDGKVVDRGHVIGSLTNTNMMTGTDWVSIEYKDGDVYGSHCGQEPRRTTVMITCDPDVDDDKAEMIFLREENSKSDHCYYLFELRHKAVCSKPKKPSRDDGLGTGSILVPVIVFATALGVYLIIGFLCLTLIWKSKDVKQIPNYKCWKVFNKLKAKTEHAGSELTKNEQQKTKHKIADHVTSKPNDI